MFMEATSDVFIDKPGTFIGKKSRRIVVRTPQGEHQEYSLLKLKEITVAGKGISFSTDLLYQAVKLGVRISFVDRLGRHYVTVASPYLTQTIETARAQMKSYDTPKRFELAKAIILQKITNQIKLVRYFFDRGGDIPDGETRQKLQGYIFSMEGICAELKSQVLSEETGREALFSFEGRAANLYWEAFGILVSDEAEFPGRKGRGAKDFVNVLLNYGYAMLFAKVETAVLSCGFLPFAGFLHADRPGKPSFVLDIMELFRQPIVDHVVLQYLVGRERVTEIDQNILRDFSRKVQARLAEKTPPLGGKRYGWQYLIYLQTQLISSFLKGERQLLVYESYGAV